MKLLICHIISFFAGFVLDLLFGDPYCLPHPIRLIGRGVTALERMLLKEKEEKSLTDGKKKRRGIILTASVLAVTGAAAAAILYTAYSLHIGAGMTVEAVMTYQILAMKCLKQESMKVYLALKEGDVEKARYALSMIVGRDTAALSDIGITKAAVETVAENCSDGVIAPMLYLAAGGPVLGFLYKAVNTMDSMVGYKNEKYLHFGSAAAKLDDAANWLPARISALLMIASSFLIGKEFCGRQAYRIFRRDRFKHASPNSAQTESVCAGALGIRLAGDAVYFGRMVKKPYIGEALRAVEYEDIPRANRLLYMTAFLCEGLCLVIMVIVSVISFR